MSAVTKSLGYYNATKSSALQFNSIVFRVVVGVLANVPVEIIAMITSIEYILNFIFEVPAGYLADKYGRVRTAALGHVTVILGLSCGYAGVLGLFSPQASYFLFVLHGVFIGLTTPLISGSIEAFYQSAAIRNSTDKDKHLLNKSLTLSKQYGRYFTTISIIVVFVMIYFFHQSIGAEHAFIPGIILWSIALIVLMRDYQKYGDEQPTSTAIMPIFRGIIKNKRLLISSFYILSIYMLMGIAMSYFIVALGRELSADSHATWVMVVVFMLSTFGFGWALVSFILPKLILKISEKNYIYLFYLLMLFIGVIMSITFPFQKNIFNYIGISVFGFLYYMSQSAIYGVAQNIALDQVDKSQFATVLSLQNMPGFLFVSLYSFYLTHYRNGCPSLQEIFISMSVISGLFILFHACFYTPDNHVVKVES